jgi:hypothetical protein
MGDTNVLNDVERIGKLLASHHFTASAFLSNYSVPLKQTR